MRAGPETGLFQNFIPFSTVTFVFIQHMISSLICQLIRDWILQKCALPFTVPFRFRLSLADLCCYLENIISISTALYRFVLRLSPSAVGKFKAVFSPLIDELTVVCQGDFTHRISEVTKKTLD